MKTKRAQGKKNPSSYSLGSEAHHSMFEDSNRRALLLTKSTHFSLACTFTISLSHFFYPLHRCHSFPTPPSHLCTLANGKTVLGKILFFTGINFRLYTLDLTLWQALSVSCPIQRPNALCADGRSPLSHVLTQKVYLFTLSCMHMQPQADKNRLMGKLHTIHTIHKLIWVNVCKESNTNADSLSVSSPPHKLRCRAEYKRTVCNWDVRPWYLCCLVQRNAFDRSGGGGGVNRSDRETFPTKDSWIVKKLKVIRQ